MSFPAAAADKTSTEPSQGPPPTPVRGAQVELRQLQARRQVTGELKAVARSHVATIEPGLIVRLPIEEGHVLRAGEVLAVLDSRHIRIEKRGLQAQAHGAEAMVSARAAEREMAQRDLAALKALDVEYASTPKELADVESALTIAVARHSKAQRDLEVVREQLKHVQTRLNDTNIKAPFDGVIITKHTEQGQWVAEGDPIAEIVATGSYDAWLNVPQRFAASVRDTTSEIQVRIDATSSTYPSKNPTIIPNVDPSARTFQLYVRIQDTKGHLAPGMSIKGWVPTTERGDFLTVSRDALLQNQAGFYVYVARQNCMRTTVAFSVPVRILFEVEDRVAIAPGQLSEGDIVIVEGNERLFPMMPIQVDTSAPRQTIRRPHVGANDLPDSSPVVDDGGV